MYNPDKVDEYSKKDLAEMIFNGEVSREQVDEDGLFRKHRPLLDEELSLMEQEEADWAEATTKNTIGSYQVYLEKYNPTIVEGETVTDGWIENTVYIGRHVEDALRLQSLVKEDKDDKTERINKLQDNIDWAKAERIDNIEAYRNYIVKYESLGGEHLVEAKQRLNQLEEDLARILTSLRMNVGKNYILPDADDEEWEKACKTNTITAYRLYLNKYTSQKGKYVTEANKRINILMDEACWANAVKQNTNDAYQDYIRKYPQGTHVTEAHDRLRPSSNPNPNPKLWVKYVLSLLVATACFFFGIQYLRKVWPFSHKEGTLISTPIAEVDSLQWAIDNQDIPLLTKYAERDSVRAYYPLANCLNKTDSIKNIYSTLYWLDKIIDPSVESLHQRIINDIQAKELDEIERRFNQVNPTSRIAESEYLSIYKDYINHFVKLSKHFPRIICEYIPIETTAENYISDRRSHDELQTEIFLEWQVQHDRFEDIKSSILNKAKEVYSKNSQR